MSFALPPLLPGFTLWFHVPCQATLGASLFRGKLGDWGTGGTLED